MQPILWIITLISLRSKTVQVSEDELLNYFINVILFYFFQQSWKVYNYRLQ